MLYTFNNPARLRFLLLINAPGIFFAFVTFDRGSFLIEDLKLRKQDYDAETEETMCSKMTKVSVVPRDRKEPFAGITNPDTFHHAHAFGCVTYYVREILTDKYLNALVMDEEVKYFDE